MLALCFPVADYGFELRKENSTEAFVTGTADSGSYSEEFVLDAGVDYELYVDVCGVVAAVVDAEDICDEVTPCDVRRPCLPCLGFLARRALRKPRAAVVATLVEYQAWSRDVCKSGASVLC